MTKVQGKIQEEAAGWFSRRLTGGLSDTEETDFRQWLAADTRHGKEFETLEKAWGTLGALYASPIIMAARDSALRHTGQEEQRLSQKQGLSSFFTGFFRPAAVAAMAAVIVFALVALDKFLFFNQPDIYSTMRGEQRAVQLADGSRLELNTGTTVEVRYTDDKRLLTLVQGQAYFTVASDPNRPFSVSLGNSVVNALGTAFEVYKKRSEVQVTLVDGSVEVTSVIAAEQGAGWRQKLVPGEQIIYTSKPTGSNSLKVQKVDIKRETAWRQGKLDFNNITLAEAVQEFGRYAASPIVIEDKKLNGLKISGVFNVGDTETALLALESGFGIMVERDDSGKIMLVGQNN